MLSDLPSFRLPVQHLGQDNMVKHNIMPCLWKWNSNYFEDNGVGLCHIRILSLAWGGPVRAIRLINQKQLLLVMVGINIILSFGNKYVVLARGIYRQAMAGVMEFLTFEEG
jgi:hypothetical protein